MREGKEERMRREKREGVSGAREEAIKRES